jgi:hypothetical protein
MVELPFYVVGLNANLNGRSMNQQGGGKTSKITAGNNVICPSNTKRIHERADML